MNNEQPAWKGWVRTGKGAPWQAVCGADSEDACWVQLLAWEPHVRTAHTDRMVLPATRDPNRERTRNW